MRQSISKYGMLLLCAALWLCPKQAVSGDATPSGQTGKHMELSARLRQIESFPMKKAFLADFNARGRMVAGASGSISGKVYGLDQTDIGTAYVEAWSENIQSDTVKDEGYKGLALLDSSFTYRIDKLSPGDFYVMVWADGYDVQYYNGAADLAKAARVTVKDNSTASGIDFRLAKPTPGTGIISGTVWDESNGKPVPGAVVSAYASDMSGKSSTFGKAACDAEGRFAITALKGGNYYVQVFADGYVWEMYDNANDSRQATLICVEEPKETAGVHFSIERSGTISGRITNSSGKPFGKAAITALGLDMEGAIPVDSLYPGPFGKYQQSGVTDESGRYVIEGIRKGSYFVFASAWTEWESIELWYNQAASSDGADTVRVRPGETTDGIDFQFPKPAGFGSISGTVLDKSGKPVPGASISMQRQAGGARVWKYASTDSSGKYGVDLVPQGDYIVSCYARIGWQSVSRWWPDAETTEGAKSVTVVGDSSISGVDFRMPLSRVNGSVSGTVRSAEGRLLRNASIQVQSRQLPPVGDKGTLSTIWAYANTDSFGSYMVRELPAETYTVYASYWEGEQFGQGWYRGKTSQESADFLVLAENQSVSGVDFSLNVKPIYGSVTGAVKDSSTGKPMTGAYVEIRKLPSGGAGFLRPFAAWNLNTTTDEKGRYVFSQLAEGDYLLNVYANGGFAYYKNASVSGMADTLSVEGGQKVLADMALVLRHDGKASISGQITMDWGWNKSDPDTQISAKPVSFKSRSATGGSMTKAVVKAKPAVTILSYPQSEWFYSAVTDSNGNYTLGELPPGDYYVSSFASYCMLEYYKDTYDPAKATLVRVGKGEAVAGVDMALSPMLFYWSMDSGMKMEGATSLSGKVEDEAGKAVAGAAVYVLDAEGNALTFAITGGDGSYEMAGIQPGNYFVQAGKPGYETQFNGTAAVMSQTTPLNVSAGVNTLNFRLMPGQQTTGIDKENGDHPSEIALLGCYPNPFNPETRIAFILPERMRVTLRVFNPLGQEITVLHDGQMEGGRHESVWRGTDKAGTALPSGLYFYRLETVQSARTGKMMLIR